MATDILKNMSNNQIIKTQEDLKLILAKNYMRQIENFFGDDKQAMKFLSGVMSAVQRNPKLLECKGETLVNAFMTMAQLGLMPSDVSGEAYVLPYNSKHGMEAQFQLGYQGIITLFYRAGGQRVRAEIVREHDTFTYENGIVHHTVDIMKSKEERGNAVGAYGIATIGGQEIALAMNARDILDMGKQFSKSFTSKFSPWNEENDPNLWMWKKTVLKQLGKLLPKNETINKAFAEDNKDSTINDRLAIPKSDMIELSMGNLEVSTENPEMPEPTYEDIPPEQESPIKKAMREGMEKAKNGEVVEDAPPMCSACNGPISDPEIAFSQQRWSKMLCKPCQPKK